MATLDMEKIKQRAVKNIDIKEALTSEEPISWSEEVLLGEKQVVVTGFPFSKL